MATFKEFLRVAEITVKDKTSGKRMKEIRQILLKHHAMSGLTPEKAVAILEDLGPTYVKIGQIASNRSDLLPKGYCDAFEKLRADVPPMPFDTVIERIEGFSRCALAGSVHRRLRKSRSGRHRSRRFTRRPPTTARSSPSRCVGRALHSRWPRILRS